MEDNNYSKRGVSSAKEDVHNAIKNLSKGIFPNSFCKILPDFLGNDPEYCVIMHADGAGTKGSLAYLYWKETGDISVFKGISQDSIVMNIDDIMCVGATNGTILISSTIGRNKHLIPGDVINELINGAEEFYEVLRKFGINIENSGGETADLGDIVRTIVVDNTIVCRVKKSDIINIDIRPGDRIVALSSFGKASYEEFYNSGMGSNGLTSGRHDIFCDDYIDKYPETFNPILLKECPELVYRGKRKVTDIINFGFCFEQKDELTLGKFVLSPTRTYAPVVKQILKEIPREKIHGIIHNSGGGQTKVLNFIKGLHVVKNLTGSVAPLFEIIQNETNTASREMYKTFNMGYRMEIYCDHETAKKIIGIAKSFNIDAKFVGTVFESETAKVTIHNGDNTEVYKK
jgi:phosphoribosylformylglycinamidine cyclo-ligase